MGAPAVTSEVPAVTVVVPTYQRRELVTRAVRSVLAQTFRDFELIVVDDGSDDGTADSLAGLDRRLHYRWQHNRGAAAARNVAIRTARAPVIAFLDSDNRWLPHHLDVVTATLARHPTAVLASTCPYGIVGGRRRPEESRLIAFPPQSLLSNPAGYLSCTVVRRDPLLAVGGFDERVAVGEDVDLRRRLAILGPFSVVRRRTIVRQATRGGLGDRGRDRAAYLTASEVTLRRAIDDIERSRGSDGRALLAQVRADLMLNAAISALARRDEDAARAALDDACAMLPELSTSPGPVLLRLRNSALERVALADRFEAAAAVWPEPRSDTAGYLRAYAAMLAARAGRPRRAARLLSRRPLLAHPGFLVRNAPLAVYFARRWLQELAHRGCEPVVK